MIIKAVSVIQLSQSDWIGLIGAIATILTGIISWFISAAYARKTMQFKELQYRLKITPLLNEKLFKETGSLDIKYKGDVIDELMFLEVDVINSGNIAIERPPIQVKSRDATHIIPAYLEDVPDGYNGYWELDRQNDTTCLINVEHINPGQVIKAKFLMNKMLLEEPMFICPMPNLKVKRVSELEVPLIAKKILEIMYPNLVNVIKLTLR